MFINLKLRSEGSFKRCFGPIPALIKAVGTAPALGLADNNSTWMHVNFWKACKKAGKKAILGVQLTVVEDLEKDRDQKRWNITLLARNVIGLKEIYELNSRSFEQMYYVPRTTISEINALSGNVIVLLGSSPDKRIQPPVKFYEYNPAHGYYNKELSAMWRGTTNIVATSDVFYPTTDDVIAYEMLDDNPERKTTPQHILNEVEILDLGYPRLAVENTQVIADMCEEYDLPQAEMVKSKQTKSLEEMCRENISKRFKEWPEEYEARLRREIDLIALKQYEDYFYLVADLCDYAKRHMLVGPARGSAAGSLVCYLLYITEIDPIPHGLLFERFIDVVRNDLPDIDLDFPDDKREMVFAYLSEKYGEECVCKIGTVSRFKPKSAIGDVAKKYGIPAWETKDVKDAIIERSSGDARAAFCITDTFESLDVGKAFIEKYPAMRNLGKIENHAKFSGCHAAGIIVCSHDIKRCCTVGKEGVSQIDKKDAEELNLLKIDVLGLRTLSVLNSCMEYLGKDPKELYDLPLDDKASFELANNRRFSGIFQFEGYALQSLSKQMNIERFDDIVAITSLARPGPLHSGGASMYVERRTGKKEVEYDHPSVEPFLSETYGIIVYQEQIMQISFAVGKMCWEDISILRKAMSKSLGDEFFGQYWLKFWEGAKENGLLEKEADTVWKNMQTFGSYGFNKCLLINTKVRMAHPNQSMPTWMTIGEIYDKYIENPMPQTKGRMPKVLSLYPDGRIRPQKVLEIHKNGVKEVRTYTFDDGTEISCTKEHQFIIDGNWQPIMNAEIGSGFAAGEYEKTEFVKQGYRGVGATYSKPGPGVPSGKDNPTYLNGKTAAIDNFRAKMDGLPCELCGAEHHRMEAHHKDLNGGFTDPDALLWLRPACHKKQHYLEGRTKVWGKGHKTTVRTLTSISEPFTGETFDLEMEEHHNFVIDGGIVTHNSHAVAYGLLSYWCLYLKAHHPLEFALACLNNEKDPECTIKMLRELVAEGYKFNPLDPAKSLESWSIADGELLGGLTGIKGVGVSKARSIIQRRQMGLPLLPGQIKLLQSAETPFDNIFETAKRFKDYYENPWKYGVESQGLTTIDKIDGDGTWIFIGKIVKRNLRDYNEYNSHKGADFKRMETNNLWLNLTLADDTDEIIAKISRYKYERMGKQIVETAKDGDYFLVKGTTRGDWRIVDVLQIRALK